VIEHREELSVAYDWVCTDEWEDRKEAIDLTTKTNVAACIGISGGKDPT
jgi:biotin synthase-like enzyme